MTDEAMLTYQSDDQFIVTLLGEIEVPFPGDVEIDEEWRYRIRVINRQNNEMIDDYLLPAGIAEVDAEDHFAGACKQWLGEVPPRQKLKASLKKPKPEPPPNPYAQLPMFGRF
jgi:hypothetical protein